MNGTGVRRDFSLFDEFIEGRAHLIGSCPTDAGVTRAEAGAGAGAFRRALCIRAPAAVVFHVPADSRRIAFGLAAGAGSPVPGGEVVLLDGKRPVFRQQVPAAGWQEHVVDLPDPGEGAQRLLTFTTIGGAGTDTASLLTDPVVETGRAATRVIGHGNRGRTLCNRDAKDIESLALVAAHPDNLAHNLYRELIYWNDELRSGTNPHIANRLDAQGRHACPHTIIELVERETERLGRIPRVLDFGAGPFSTLVYLQRSGKADVTAIDALSSEYAQLLERHGIDDWPLVPRRGLGEFLAESGQRFDIVHVSNALDHTQCPALSWLNLFEVTEVGGLLTHRHSICEATREQFDQLHQYDLFPRGESMWITDRDGRSFSLTDELPLECELYDRYTGADFDWFEGIYRKTAADGRSSATWLNHLLEQLTATFRRRNAWAFELEGFVNRSVDLSDAFAGLPYSVEHPDP